MKKRRWIHDRISAVFYCSPSFFKLALGKPFRGRVFRPIDIAQRNVLLEIIFRHMVMEIKEIALLRLFLRPHMEANRIFIGINVVNVKYLFRMVAGGFF